MSNDNGQVPNPMLRAHVSDHSFVLTLRKSHIKVLNAIAHNNRQLAGECSWFVPAAKGLEQRGLLVHKGKHGEGENFVQKAPYTYGMQLNDWYRLTRAGWATFQLLVEAGIATPVRVKRRLVA